MYFAAAHQSANGTSRRIAAVRRFGRDRSEADMPRASGAGRQRLPRAEQFACERRASSAPPPLTRRFMESIPELIVAGHGDHPPRRMQRQYPLRRGGRRYTWQITITLGRICGGCSAPQLAHRVDSRRCEGSDAIGAKRTCRERRERVDLTKMTLMHGPAVRCKRVSSIWRTCGLASMYPASDWSVLCSEPSWISARVRSYYRTGLEWAIWVTSVRMRR